MEYFSAIKSNELLIYTTWIDVKGIRLNEKGQSQKAILCMVSFIAILKWQNYGERDQSSGVWFGEKGGEEVSMSIKTILVMKQFDHMWYLHIW